MPRRDQDPAPAPRVQRSLAAMAAAAIGVSVLAIATLLIAQAAGVRSSALSTGPLEVVGLLPLPGLTLGLLLILALLVVAVVGRARSARRDAASRRH